MNEAFEGDTYIKEELIKLRDKFGLKLCVETGTQYGSTTLELDRIFKSVVTIEADKSLCEVAVQRFEHTDILLLCGLSDKILQIFKFKDNILYYLDAHGGKTGGCPLKEELILITINNHKNVCIAIHDFKVPGKDFGFDTFDDFELRYEEIEPYLKMIYEDRFDYHYNTEANGARQGIIFIYPKK